MPPCPWKLININISEKISSRTAAHGNCRRLWVLWARSLIFGYDVSSINILEGSKTRRTTFFSPTPHQQRGHTLGFNTSENNYIFIYVPIINAVCHHGTQDPSVQRTLVTLPTLWAEPDHPPFEFCDSKETLHLEWCWFSTVWSKECTYNPVTDSEEVWIISF